MYSAIFDLDGTLVDSFDAHLRAWQAMSAAHGVPITLERFEAHFGRRNDHMLREIWLEAGRGALSDERMMELSRDKESRYRELVSGKGVRDLFPVMEGGPGLLRALRAAGWTLAVGSSADPANVELALDGLGARDHFDAIVHGEDVTRGKPDPECFLKAAERLRREPRRCVVIEDAPAGIAAAKAAGMRCVALTSKGHRAELQREADLVVPHLRELTPQRLAALFPNDDLS